VGGVSIWKQWLGVAVGVLLSSAFVLSGLVYWRVARSSVVGAPQGNAGIGTSHQVGGLGQFRRGEPAECDG
jgi:hypothetical protein